MTELEWIIFGLEICGTIAFAFSGALVAIEKKMDILGIVILGVTTALGGGILRDVLLGNTPPQAFRNPIYAVVATLVSLLAFVPWVREGVQRKKRIYDTVMLVMDSAGLGIFTVVGLSIAYDLFPNSFLQCFVGVLTGVGGGVLRDIMAGNVPFIFSKQFYASASIIGVILTRIIWGMFGEVPAMILGVICVFCLRMMAAKYRWHLPHA